MLLLIGRLASETLSLLLLGCRPASRSISGPEAISSPRLPAPCCYFRSSETKRAKVVTALSPSSSLSASGSQLCRGSQALSLSFLEQPPTPPSSSCMHHRRGCEQDPSRPIHHLISSSSSRHLTSLALFTPHPAPQLPKPHSEPTTLAKMVDNDKQSSIPLQSMQKPEDVDEFSPNDTLEIKSVERFLQAARRLVRSLPGPKERRLIGLTLSFVFLFTNHRRVRQINPTPLLAMPLRDHTSYSTCTGHCGLWTGWNLPARSPPRLNLKRSTSPHGSVSPAVLLLCPLPRFFAEDLGISRRGQGTGRKRRYMS